jgi:hypothetical protein
MYIGNKKALAVYVMLALGSGIAHAGQTAVLCTAITNTGNNNFTMLDGTGAIVGGTNDASFTWDGTMFNASGDYTGPGSVTNAAITSPTAFFSHTWTAHDVQVFAPGSYSFDTSLGTTNAPLMQTLVVGSDQLGMHMLFDWNTTTNIDVVVVLNKSQSFGSGLSSFVNPTTCASAGSNCLWTGATIPGGAGNRPAGNKVWMLVSVDTAGGDGIPGSAMVDGPFSGFNANFNFNGTLSPSDGTCGPAVDTTPDAFSFTGVINTALSTLYTSNTITVSGLGVSQSIPNPSQTAPVTITGGQYSKNGGVPTSAAGTAANGDTFTVQGTSGSANGMTTTVSLSIGGVSSSFTISTPAAVGVQGSNFTMLDASGGVVGGTNDVAASWDSACETSATSTNFTHMSLSSSTPFFSYTWTAHDIRVFCPGTYTIDTTCTIAQLHAGTYPCNNLPLPAGQTQQFYTFIVGPGQIGAHMLFDWNVTQNIDVVEVWNTNAVFEPSQMYTGAAACNNPLTVWNLMSTDWDGDGKNGGAMIDGPFSQFSANFNIRTSGTPLTCSAYTPSVNVADPSNTAGCSISSRPSSGTERGDWWLVAGFLAWLGGIQMRLKRKTRS